MIIPILAALVPSLVGLAEKLIPQSGAGKEKKEFVTTILGKIYDRFLVSRIPDFPGIDERALFLELGSHLVDFASDKLFNKKSE